MSWNFLQKLLPPKNFLGVDIGTSSIKIVEISQSANKSKLKNYGFISADILSKNSFWTFKKNNILFSTEDVVKGIKAILQEADIKTRRAIFSVPDFSTFFTNFELPPIKKEELASTVQYKARQYIPLPLKEVTLNWQVIKGKFLDQKGYDPNKQEKLKILLVAVSNEVINQYKEIAILSELELISLEAEVFSLIRALVNENEKDPIALIEIGSKSTTCSIVEQGKMENSYSIDISSDEFNKIIVEKFNIDYLEAEKLKKEYGLLKKENGISHLLFPLVDIILVEVQKAFNNFYQKEKKEIKKIILAGGAVLLPGLREYFENRLKKEIIISQPFSKLDYPLVLEQTLKEIGPSYSIAIGAALRGK